MGFDNKYPYTDFHEINLDWLLEKVKGIDDRFVAIEEKVAELSEDLDIQTGRIDAALDAITFIRNHYPAMIASQYDESRQYDPGEIAIYDNELYIALPGETPGPWNGNYWNKTSLGDELGTIIIKVNDIILPDLTNINNVLAEYGTLFDDIVETYDPNFTYFKNNFVKYEDHIYMVMVDSTTNPPTDTTDWDPVTFANVFSYYINNLNVFVPEFQDNVPYRQYDYVRYNNYVYYLKEATFTGPWDPTKWENCVLSQEEAFHTRAFYDMFGTLYGWYKSFDDADTYNKGDVVNYNGTLYECLEDNVTGVWDASKWQVQKVTDAMTDVNTYYKNFPVKTINGNPIEITDAVAAPADAAIVSFLPIQEGSGDPSPDNVRPISGWDSLHFYISGKNLFDKTAITDGSWLSTTTGEVETSSSTTNYVVSDYIPVMANKTVYIPASNTVRRWFYDISHNAITYLNNLGNQAYTPTQDGYIRVSINKTQIDINGYQVEYGSTATTYESYQGTTHTATFQNTEYDGKVVWKDGVVKAIIDMAIVDLGSLTWIYNASFANPIFYAPLPTKVNNRENTGLCSCYPVNPVNATGALNAAGILNDNEIALSINTESYHLFIRDESFTSAESLTEFLNGKTLVYELETPTEITLTPEDIELLRGDNAIWSDGDDVTVDYHYAAVESSFASGEATKIGMFGNKDLCEFIYTEDGLTPLASMTITTGFDFSTFEVDRILSIDVICCDTVSDTYESVQDERIYLTNTGDLHIDAGAISNTMNVSVVIRFVKQ